MGVRELRLALATLASFQLIFVLEWLPEMLPLARYQLGYSSAHFDVSNRNTHLRPYEFSLEKWQPARREATLGSLSSATALRRALPAATTAQLEQHLAYGKSQRKMDVRLMTALQVLQVLQEEEHERDGFGLLSV